MQSRFRNYTKTEFEILETENLETEAIQIQINKSYRWKVETKILESEAIQSYRSSRFRN
jgi:hypothetical protein